MLDTPDTGGGGGVRESGFSGQHFICSVLVKSEKNNGVASTNWESQLAANVRVHREREREEGGGLGVLAGRVYPDREFCACQTSQCQGT